MHIHFHKYQSEYVHILPIHNFVFLAKHAEIFMQVEDE
jgi:hypothetical protein